MQPASNDISFNLFGFPTTIQPFFWLIAAIITAVHLGPINDMPTWIAHLLVGILGVCLSILVHELGHAFSFRHIFNSPCAIVLHGFGGVAIPLQQHRRDYSFYGVVLECFLSFSGSLAQFILAFCAIVLLYVLPEANDGLVIVLFKYFLIWTAFVSIFWGVLNLLPIFPMDGGHISREICIYLFSHHGVKLSLIFSMMLAAFCAVLALIFGQIPITVIFVYFAYLNFMEMSSGSR